jgi:CheY-like chemotaxis protein
MHGYRTRGVSSRSEAIDAVAVEYPAVVLVDLDVLTSTDGDFEDLREWAGLHSIPVVTILGQASPTDPSSALQGGRWLVKPVSDARLTDSVATAIAAAQLGEIPRRQGEVQPVGSR